MSRQLMKVGEAIPHLHHNHSAAGLGTWAVRHGENWEAAWNRCDRGYYLLAVLPALQFPKETTTSVGLEVIRWANRVALQTELLHQPSPFVAESFGKIEAAIDRVAPMLMLDEMDVDRRSFGLDEFWGYPWVGGVLWAMRLLRDAARADDRLHEGGYLHAVGLQVTKMLEPNNSYRPWSASELADAVRGLVPWTEVRGYVDDAVPPPEWKGRGRWQANADRRIRPYAGPAARRMCDSSYATYLRSQKPPKSPIDGLRSIKCPACKNRMAAGSGPDWRRHGNRVRTEGPMYHYEAQPRASGVRPQSPPP